MTKYTRTTVTFVKHPQGIYEVSIHIHKQHGSDATVNTTSNQFSTYEEAETYARRFLA